MGFFWADKKQATNNTPHYSENNTSTCPVISHEVKGADTSGCPVMHGTNGTTGSTEGCPVVGINSSTDLNPLNNIPHNLSSSKQQDQKLDLPTDRTVSSIPKGKADEFWEYPSPQQMYNAMVRKGKIDPNTGEEIPEDAVESMVYVHNFLNEGCWEEILEWESKYIKESHMQPKLLQFMGKPNQLTPRARWYNLLGTLFPGSFSAELPFDRHDWIVLRPDPTSSDMEHPGYRKIRYVIDFYGGPDDDDGLPTFNLDVRPGLDNITNAKDRFHKWVSPVWDEYFKHEK